MWGENREMRNLAYSGAALGGGKALKEQADLLVEVILDDQEPSRHEG